MNPREMLWNTNDYVKQYDNIPEDGVLAQSKDVKNKE